MTSRIVVLSDAVIGRIAAGEVVERPSSVLKELIENSIDAGSHRIDVSVTGGPTGVLRVSDDGCGMSPEELRLAVHRHATSKLSDESSLEAIESLGFRGEGLPAVASVARVELLSSRGNGEAARLDVDNGEVGAVEPAARDQGTTISVKDLFFSTPARKKFLKSDAAELRHISRLVQAYAMAYPQISISLEMEKRKLLNLDAASDRHERLTQILGTNRVERLMAVNHEAPHLKLEGFLGVPEDSRARSGHQMFFINGRWVQSPLLRQVTRLAYGDLIPPARHPEAFLWLSVPPDSVDVNVHPTKVEVRLRDERKLYPQLISALKPQVESYYPSLNVNKVGTREDPDPPLPDSRQIPLLPASPRDYFHSAPPPGKVSEETPQVLPFPTSIQTPSGSEGHSEDPVRADLWQIQDTYILARVSDGLLIIDQHAAHERVLYEQALRRFEGEPPASQELLFPTVVEFAPDEYSVLLNAHAALEKLGFHLENFGGTTVLVHAIPVGVRQWNHGALLRDILDHFADLPGELDIIEKVCRSVACHGAVKAGQKLTLEEMNELLDQLFATSKPQGDPHGRPVFLRLGLAELNRRFGRT